MNRKTYDELPDKPKVHTSFWGGTHVDPIELLNSKKGQDALKMVRDLKEKLEGEHKQRLSSAE